MPQYTLDELEKFNLSEWHQALLFGNTIAEIRENNPDRIIETWMDLNTFKIIKEDGTEPHFINPYSKEDLKKFDKLMADAQKDIDEKIKEILGND